MKSSKTSFLRNCISGWNVRGNSTPFSNFASEIELLFSGWFFPHVGGPVFGFSNSSIYKVACQRLKTFTL